jgi:hypothetical protein
MKSLVMIGVLRHHSDGVYFLQFAVQFKYLKGCQLDLHLQHLNAFDRIVEYFRQVFLTASDHMQTRQRYKHCMF